MTANSWRSQTLRLLDPPASDDSIALKGHTKSLVTIAASLLAESTAALALDLFISTSDLKDAVNDLTEIANHAAELAYRLWTQKANMTVLDLVGLDQSIISIGQSFSGRTDVLEAHPLHRRELHIDRGALDGRKIAMVASPAIVIYGDTDGQDFSDETYHVLKKAVVWME